MLLEAVAQKSGPRPGRESENGIHAIAGSGMVRSVVDLLSPAQGPETGADARGLADDLTPGTQAERSLVEPQWFASQCPAVRAQLDPPGRPSHVVS